MVNSLYQLHPYVNGLSQSVEFLPCSYLPQTELRETKTLVFHEGSINKILIPVQIEEDIIVLFSIFGLTGCRVQ